ncbi:hypothetical protein QA942_34540 [Streptomyces sp. B21-106]|uniref:hypothetical protein n=1 Tax=Streptomyces sp. B21-106 TaxID=3039418 RepID=UPI002FF1A60E
MQRVHAPGQHVPCNLASLNLMKFLKDDSKGHQSFDADRFQKVVELVITAMDISICFADFPDPEGSARTRARSASSASATPTSAPC